MHLKFFRIQTEINDNTNCYPTNLVNSNVLVRHFRNHITFYAIKQPNIKLPRIPKANRQRYNALMYNKKVCVRSFRDIQ